MTCRHTKGDPSCSSYSTYLREAEDTKLLAKAKKLGIKVTDPETPDSERFEIVRDQLVGPHLVLIVQYPNCNKCSYEGRKVLVFLNTGYAAAFKWRKIDPHFRDPKKPSPPREAPSPAARFPASDEGWADAIAYANKKTER